MLLSIITVNLNNLTGLKKTAESILSQSCKDYEWIVIDGGSTDGSKEYLESIAEYIAFWVSEPDTGIYNAMNKGIAKAHGNYLHFLNSGDYYCDCNVIGDFKSQNTKEYIVYGNFYSVEDDSAINMSNLTITPDIISFFDYYWSRVQLNHQSLFIKRACFEEKYDESYCIAADRAHILKLLYKGCSVKKWNRPVVCYNINGISTTNKKVRDEEFVKSRLVLPKTIQKELTEHLLCRMELEKLNEADISKMAIEIMNSNKILRYVLRIFLYPIYWAAFLLKKAK